MAAMSFTTPIYPGIDLEENQSPKLKAMGIAFTILTAVTVMLRFISRWLRKIDIGTDDWLLLASAVFAWAYNAVIMVEADYHYYGQHIHKSNIHHLKEYLKGLYSLAVVYPVALTLSKLSLLALYWRIFSSSGVKLPIQIASLINIAWMIAAVLVGLFSCKPVSGFWDVTVPASCIQEFNFFLANECLTVALDLVVLLIPLWAIAQIQRSLEQRISIGSTFALGLVVTVVSAVRLWQLVLAQRRPGFDPTFNHTPAALWAIVEINVWILVASIPTFRPLIHDLYKRAKASTIKENSLTAVPNMKAGKGESKGSGRLKTFWLDSTRSISQEGYISQTSFDMRWSGNQPDIEQQGNE